MAEFYFEARNSDGKKITGTRQADSEEAVAGMLLQEQLTPVLIRSASTSISFQFPQLPFGKKKPATEELIMFCQQMHSMHKAGVPIMQSIQRIAETTENKLLKSTLENIAEQLKLGRTLSVAMKQHTTIFSELFVNVVAVGESSGHLDRSFMSLFEYLKTEDETKARFKSAIRYPIIVISSIIAAILVINIFIIPAFAKAFNSFNAELPLPTRILIGTSSFLENYWPALLIVLFFVVMGIRYYLNTDKGLINWHRYLTKIKIIGPIIHRILLSRFAKTFSIILKSGISPNEGLTMVGQSMGNKYMQQKIAEIHQGITRGETITQAAEKSHIFTPLVMQMLAVGEETGNMDEMLNEVADFYERQVDYDLSKLSDAIEPILLIAVGIMVLILALGVFLPMWDMVSFAN